MSWAEVSATVAEQAAAYEALRKARTEHREGSRKARLAEERWVAAVAARAAALLAQWTEEDGYHKDKPALGPVLRRYYASVLPPYQKGKKR